MDDIFIFGGVAILSYGEMASLQFGATYLKIGLKQKRRKTIGEPRKYMLMEGACRLFQFSWSPRAVFLIHVLLALVDDLEIYTVSKRIS